MNRGRRATWVGLLVGVAIVAVGVAMVVPAVLRLRARAGLAACADHLRQVGVALRAYAGDGGALPVSPTIENPHADLVHALTATGHLGDPANYFCPAEARAEYQYDADRFRAGDIGYFYYGAVAAGPDAGLSKFLRDGVTWPRRLTLAMDPRTWAMSDRWASGEATNHGGYRKGVNYLTLDGSVAFVAESPRQAFR